MKVRKFLAITAVFLLVTMACPASYRLSSANAQGSNSADSSSNRIQVNFKVYPNATIAVDGALNLTNPPSESTYLPQVNSSVGFETTGNTTTETSNATAVFSGSDYSYLNSTEIHAAEVYENGIENETLSASTILPTDEATVYPYNTTDVNLNATYSGGLFKLDVSGQTVLPAALSSVFPFNMSDATVRADFDGAVVQGNVTFHGIAGSPFGDVTLYFSGNRTFLQLTGDVNVTYSSFEDMVVNEANVSQFVANLNANFTGEGPNSLYNGTSGYLTCTYLNLTQIPWSDPALGQDVMYNGTIVGNFTGGLAELVFPSESGDSDMQQVAYASLESADYSVQSASLVLSYYHESQIAQVNLHAACNLQELCDNLITLIPPATPSSLSSFLTEHQVLALLEIANATSYAVKDTGVNASYSSRNGEMSMNAWLLSNVTQLNDDIISILPGLAPPNSSYLQDLYDSYLNTTYSTVNSSMMKFDMVNGTMTFDSTETIQGNFDAELNREKSIYIDEINATASGMTLPWEIRLLNQTDINIDNLQAQFVSGQDWVYASFGGLVLQPPQDAVNAMTFKLKSWLNTTTDISAPPTGNEELTVTITGESSGNQTVILSAPPDVPAPDQMSADNTNMTWNNVSMSGLQDLTFLTAFNQPISFQGGTYNVPVMTNSTVTNFVFNPDAMQMSFNVSSPSGTTGFSNVTVPRSLLNANSTSDWNVILDGNPLSQQQFSITENDQYVFIYLNYTHADHQVIIRGTQLLPEFQPSFLPMFFATIVALLGVAAIKRRRKRAPACS